MASWAHGGLTYTTPPPDREVKASRWDPAKHPRDRHGRFVHVGGKVRLSDGTVGKVTAVAGGKVHVTAGGKTRTVAAWTVAVVDDHTADHGPSASRAPAAAAPSKARGARRAATRAAPSVHTSPKDAAPAAKPPKPDRRPAGKKGPYATPAEGVARSATSASQRSKVAALFDVEGQPPQVREAARLLGHDHPLTADQATALTAAMRKTTDGGGMSKGDARVLHRAADRLDAIPAHLTGITPEHVPGRRGVTKTTVADLAEGDQVALPGAGGRADIRTVVASAPRYDHHEVTLQDADGTTETRILVPSTTAYVLPDLPGPVPVKPTGGGSREHIHPDQIRPGDVINLGSFWTPDERLTVHTARTVDAAGLMWAITVTGPGETQPHELTVHDDTGLPSVMRFSRGEQSASQPWDTLIPDDKLKTITARSLKTGDRFVLPGYSGDHVTITGVSPSGTDVEVTYRTDQGRVGVATLPKAEKVTRVAAGGSNAAARAEQVRQAATVRGTSRDVAYHLAGIHQDVRAEAFSVAISTLDSLARGDADTGKVIDTVARDVADIGPQSDYHLQKAKETLVSHLTGDALMRQPGGLAAAMRSASAAADSLQPILDSVVTGARARELERITAVIRDAEPAQPGQSKAAAAAQALRDLSYSSEFDERADYTEAARALATGALQLGRADTGGAVPERLLPDLPADTPLADRMAAYRDVLGPGFGQAVMKVNTFAATTLADLQAGKVPKVETAEMPVKVTREADGGPGVTALTHLAVVRAAGADLDAELQRRIDADMVTFRKEAEARQTEFEKISTRLQPLLMQKSDMEAQARDEFARLHGYDTLRALQADLIGKDPALVRQLTRQARDYAQAKTADLAKKVDALSQQAVANVARKDAAERAEAEARRRHTIGILSEVRVSGMGGTGPTYRGADGAELPGDDPLVEPMRYAEAGYPADWLTLAQGDLTLVETPRGYYSHPQSELALSPAPERVSGSGALGGTADHELGHRMERMVPGLLAAEEALLWDRTSTGPVGSRKRTPKTRIYAGKDEMAYKDDFPEHYTGKDYYYGNDPLAFEVFTTAKESLTSGSRYLDDDLRHWTLGVLALLGHTGTGRRKGK